MADSDIRALEERISATVDQREKVGLLVELSHLIRFRDLDRALALAEEALQLAQVTGDPRSIAISILQTGDCHRFRSEYEAAQEDFDRAWEVIAGLPEDRALMARYHTGLGNLMLITNRCREAVEQFGSALEIYTGDDNRTEMARLLCYQGQAEGRLRNDLAALELFKQGLEIATALGDFDLMGLASNCIGMIYCELGNGERALHYLSRALEYRSGSAGIVQIAALHKSIVHAYRDLGNFDSAIEHSKKALGLYRQAKIPEGIATVLVNLGHIYEELQEYDTAMEYLQEALAVAEQADEEFLVESATMAIGMIYWRKGELAKAIQYQEKVLSRQHEESYWNTIWSAYWVLTNVHEELGNAQEALKYYKLWAEMREQMEGKAKAEAIADAERRMLLALHEQEKEIYRLKNEQLERELARDRRELAALAAHLSQKNALMASLEQKVRQLDASPGSGRLAESLQAELRRTWDEGGQWQVFEERFRQVHPEFVRTLLGRYPELSPTEVKVCALMSINITTKEIADILYTSVRTVEGHRRFIRRKLGLERDANLSTFLATLG